MRKVSILGRCDISFAKVSNIWQGGLPRTDAHLFSSASQTHHFALARFCCVCTRAGVHGFTCSPTMALREPPPHHGSEVLIGSLLPDKAKQEPCWRAWLIHSRYLSILTQHTISRAELTLLGSLIEEHQNAFAQVSLGRSYINGDSLTPYMDAPFLL